MVFVSPPAITTACAFAETKFPEPPPTVERGARMLFAKPPEIVE